MSATTQTFVGPAREPSAELADATSTKPGERKPPAKAADGGPNGGKGWDAEQELELWLLRNPSTGQRALGYDLIGPMLGRTNTACRIQVCHLRKKVKAKGYEATFGQQQPQGPGQPTRVGIVAAPRAAKRKAAIISMTEAVRPAKVKKAAAPRRGENVGVATVKLAEETAETVAHQVAVFRTVHGYKTDASGQSPAVETNKTTAFADPQKQSMVERHRQYMNDTYWSPVPEQEAEDDHNAIDPQVLDAALGLLKLAQGLGSRLSPSAQYAVQSRGQQDQRMSINSLINGE